MIKKIFGDKLLFTSILSLLLAILAIVAIGYAWFATTNESKAPFVAEVGNYGAVYNLKQNVAGQLEGETGEVERFNFNDIMPGSMHTFVLTVGAESTSEGQMSIYFNGVKSYQYVDAENMTDVFTNQYEKIQYAFSYKVDQVFWIPFDSVDLEVEVEQTDIDGSLQSFIDTFGWLPWTDQEKDAYYQYKEIDEDGHTIFPRTMFNHVLSGTTPEDYRDEYNYSMLNNVIMTGRDDDASASQKCAFAIIFTIMFESPCSLPSVFPADQEVNETIYENQVIQIEHIVIQSSKKED